jgi:alkylation response protein AidB-like acyl-CoA dehydrogenase
VDLRLTEEQRAVRETYRALFRNESPPDRVRTAESAGLDRSLWERYALTGALGIGVPDDNGGGGGGLLDLALVAEEAGRHLAPIPVVEAAVAARLLARVGADGLMEPVLTGKHIMAVCTAAGPVRRQLLAIGAVGDAVLALREGELRYVCRPKGMATAPFPNLGGLPMARWPEADDGDLLADEARCRADFDVALDENRVLRAASLVGLAAEAIAIGVRYAVDRRAFGQPIGMYQAVAHPFADAVTAVDGARLLVWKACWAMESGHDDAAALAAMAFAFAAETAYQAAAHSLHVHGGYGFMEEYDIQLYYRRAKAWATVFADPRRELLTVADRRFGDAHPRGFLPPGPE